MHKRYNIFVVARNYCRGYYKYLVNRTSIRKVKEARELFSYSLKTICGLEAIEYNKSIERYGEECIKYMKEEIPDVPKHPEKIPFEERVRLCNVANWYVREISVSYESIRSGRLR